MSTNNHAAVHAEATSSSPLSPLLPAVMGTLFVLLFLLGLWLISTAAAATQGKSVLLKFYESDQNRLLVIFGLYLIPFAGIAFLWFMASLHEWMIQRAGRTGSCRVCNWAAPSSLWRCPSARRQLEPP